MEEAPWLCTHIIASEKCVKFKVFSSMSTNPLHFLATVLKLSVFHNSKRSPLIDIQPRNWEDLVSMVFTKWWYLLRYIEFHTIVTMRILET